MAVQVGLDSGQNLNKSTHCGLHSVYIRHAHFEVSSFMTDFRENTRLYKHGMLESIYHHVFVWRISWVTLLWFEIFATHSKQARQLTCSYALSADLVPGSTRFRHRVYNDFSGEKVPLDASGRCWEESFSWCVCVLCVLCILCVVRVCIRRLGAVLIRDFHGCTVFWSFI